ncbi:peptidase [Glaciimonas immobilis]|uniref:Peptidase n=1 Tax=Glaciimonas immobilis TaxID=728004 RepID=A0A840RPR0_9BURK|nr:peptidase [Glaciimonas immobilis]KAF3999059.1 peptidase [Glaciimonas immobilis]MBB5198489.1 hypothetical protein [Glaciimonas immobilis]
MNLLHIFKAGTHTDINGNKVTLTAADLAASAAAYDPAIHEAPIVVGHPALDAPAYGWVKALSECNGDLNAEPVQVPAAFAEIVNSGSYKKISSSFYGPHVASNPVPGVWYLKHVGFLGATAPAVKGLRQASFAAGEEDGIFEFADWTLVNQSSMWSRLRDWLIAKEGLQVADQIIPDYHIINMRDAGREDAPTDAITLTYSEENTVTPEQAAAMQKENLEIKAVLSASTAREAKRIADMRNAGNVAFADAQIAAGTLAPKHQETVLAFLNFSEQPLADGGAVSFGEGEDKQALATAFKSFLSELPPVVAFGEQATKDRATSVSTINPLLADAERRKQ